MNFKIIPILILILINLLVSCVKTDYSATGEDKKNLNIAILYKQRECGTAPKFPLYVQENSPGSAVQLCAFAIISESCPFENYPLICWEIYKYDIPSTGKKSGKSIFEVF